MPEANSSDPVRYDRSSGTRYVLFDDASKTDTSEVFGVGFNHGVILSAYGLAQKQRSGDGPATLQQAIVEKVTNRMTEMPYQPWYCGTDNKVIFPGFEIIKDEDVTQCGSWCLTACQNLVVLAVPGAYRLRLDDPAAIGNVYIELISLERDVLAHIPQDLFFGKIS